MKLKKRTTENASIESYRAICGCYCAKCLCSCYNVTEFATDNAQQKDIVRANMYQSNFNIK